ALHFERRVAFLVVVLSVLILDRGRVARPIGECKACADDGQPCGHDKSHNNVSHGYILGLARPTRRPSPHGYSSRSRVDPRSGAATRRATARFQGSANTVSWPPSDV